MKAAVSVAARRCACLIFVFLARRQETPDPDNNDIYLSYFIFRSFWGFLQCEATGRGFF